MRKVRDCEGYYMKNNNNKWVFVKIWVCINFFFKIFLHIKSLMTDEIEAQ